jgi:hypothetical protein
MDDLVAFLVQAYADHPDYRPEWAPEGSST